MLWAHRNTYIHIDPTGIPDGSRALVNRHEINSRKERYTVMIRGLGRKNRKTRGGVGARAAREADLFGIFRRRGTKNARRLTGYDTVRRQLRHSHAVRSCARQHAYTLCQHARVVIGGGPFSFVNSDHRDCRTCRRRISKVKFLFFFLFRSIGDTR